MNTETHGCTEGANFREFELGKIIGAVKGFAPVEPQIVGVVCSPVGFRKITEDFQAMKPTSIELLRLGGARVDAPLLMGMEIHEMRGQEVECLAFYDREKMREYLDGGKPMTIAEA
ncbi:MAG TPA: hypothetical protein VGH19_06575 [Verrucomicrobiae bacterium]